GWQIDLYGSREWLERGEDLSALEAASGDQFETSDFPLDELDLSPDTLAALSAAGYDTFLQIIDLERRDFLAIPGLGEAEADRLLELIDEPRVVGGGAGADAGDEEPDGPVSDGESVGTESGADDERAEA